MKAAGIPINRGMALAPARVVPPWPVFSDEKREFHTPKERQIASVQNAVSSLSAFYTESANNFYAIGDNTRGDISPTEVYSGVISHYVTRFPTLSLYTAHCTAAA